MSTIQAGLGYNVRKGFLDPYNGLYDGHFQHKLDEPTYLSFSIDFGNFLRAYLPGNWTADLFSYTNYDELPQALFCPPSNDTEDWNAREQYCAYTYLLDRDEKLRAGMLEEFLIGWDELQKDFQYYFQEISGLDSLLKVDPKSGIRVKEGKIKIKCLEGLDLKVKYLLNLYRKIAWDDTYQRWILPDIYRYFNMYIYITEIRQFHQSNLDGSYVYNPESLTSDTKKAGKKKLFDFNYNLKGILGGSQQSSSGEQLILSVIDDMLPTIRIKCNMCEFVLDSWLNDSYSINNDKAEETTFEISVKNIDVDQQYKLNGYDNVIKDSYDRVLIRRAKDYNWNDNDALGSWYAYSQRLINLPEQERTHIYNTDEQSGSSKTWLANAFEWGKAWLGNTVEKAVDRLMTKNIIGNLSMVGIINALQSKDLVTAFGAVRLATAKTGFTPSSEISGYDMMTEVIKGIASSSATSKEQEMVIDAAREMLKEPYNIQLSSQMPEEEILRKLADYQYGPLYDKITNHDRSHATDLDGGPNGNLIPNNSDAKAPNMNMISNHSSLDRSTATDLDGGPNGNLVSNYNEPEVPNMQMTENPYEGDRSIATDLDGGPEGSLIENIHNPKVGPMDLVENIHNPKVSLMDMTENPYEGDRSIATDLDGGPNGTLTSNYHDPLIPSMDLVSNFHDGDRSIATDLDGGPNGTLISNSHNPEIPGMNMTNNFHEGDRSIATNLDGGPNGNLTTNYNDPSVSPMDLIENHHYGDRSIATDLDGIEIPNLVTNYNKPEQVQMQLTPNHNDTEIPSMAMISNVVESTESHRMEMVHNIPEEKYKKVSNPLESDKIKTHDTFQALTLNSYEEKSKATSESKIWNDIVPIDSASDLGSLTKNINSIFDMGKNIKMTENKKPIESSPEMKMTSNVAKPKVEKMKLVSNKYDGPVSLATTQNIIEH